MVKFDRWVKGLLGLFFVLVVFSCSSTSSTVKMNKVYLEKPMTVLLDIRESYKVDFLSGYRERMSEGLIGITLVTAIDASMGKQYARGKEIISNFVPKVVPLFIERLRTDFPTYTFVVLNSAEITNFEQDKFLLQEKYGADAYLMLNIEFGILRYEGLFGWEYLVRGKVSGTMYDLREEKTKGKKTVIWNDKTPPYDSKWKSGANLDRFLEDDIINPLLDDCLTNTYNQFIRVIQEVKYKEMEKL